MFVRMSVHVCTRVHVIVSVLVNRVRVHFRVCVHVRVRVLVSRHHYISSTRRAKLSCLLAPVSLFFWNRYRCTHRVARPLHPVSVPRFHIFPCFLLSFPSEFPSFSCFFWCPPEFWVLISPLFRSDFVIRAECDAASSDGHWSVFVHVFVGVWGGGRHHDYRRVRDDTGSFPHVSSSWWYR